MNKLYTRILVCARIASAQNDCNPLERAWKAKQPLKNPRITYVLEKLRDGWSPEQISGRLKLERAKDASWQIEMETIYRFHLPKGESSPGLVEILKKKAKKK